MNDGKMTYEDWLRGCVHHDGRHGEVTLPTDKVLEIANYIQLTRANLVDGMIELPPYDRKTEPNSSEIPNNCECEPRKEQNFCGKCRYLYRDFKYGLSCYRLMDNEPCKYEERKTEPTISKMEQVDKDINARSKDEPQTMLNDGTLVINVEDATKVGRVLIGDDKNRGGLYYPDDEDEPQTCSVSGRPYSECADCEHFRCTADEPQTERNEK